MLVLLQVVFVEGIVRCSRDGLTIHVVIVSHRIIFDLAKRCLEIDGDKDSFCRYCCHLGVLKGRRFLLVSECVCVATEYCEYGDDFREQEYKFLPKNE